MAWQLRILVVLAEGSGLAASIHSSHYCVRVSHLFSVRTAFVQSMQGSSCAAQEHTPSATLDPRVLKINRFETLIAKGT